MPAVEAFSAFDCYLQCTSPALLRTGMPTFTVGLTGATGTRLQAHIEVRTAPDDRAPLVTSGTTSLVHVPQNTQWRAPEGLLSHGTTYYWRSRAVDEADRMSKWTAWQSFTVDTERPTAPVVRSAEYPEREWGGLLGTPGNFTFTTPSADAQQFLWDLNYGDITTTPAVGTAPRTAAVAFTPARDGVNVLNVFVLDPAGNRSDTATYQFWVTPPPVRFAHWTLDETDGVTAADSGTLGATATLSGDAAFGGGYVDGSGGALLAGDGQIGAADVLDPTRSFTVMAWVNASQLDGRHTVLSQHGDGSGFELYADAAANGGAGGWCVTMTGAEGTGPATACTAYALPATGQWTHVAALHDAITGRLAVYVGGGDNCLGETAPTTYTATGSAAGTFLIGQSAAGQGWYGQIDDVYAHQRAVSETTICQQASW